MGKIEDRLDDWLGEVAGPSASLVSWITLGYPTAPNSGGAKDSMDSYLAERGLDPERQVAQGHAQLVAVLTPAELLVGSVGGFGRIKPKELLVSAPVEQVCLEWWDQRQVGPDQRHMLFVLGDDWVRTSARIDRRTNADGFVEALGERATQVKA